MTSSSFSASLLQWFDVHGRRDLPWQFDRSPYRVWVSEVMLQQTQVATVVPYFLRFIERFPTVTALADAALDDVLHHWSGLGYYARGRNLHRAAQVIRDQYRGEFPQTFDAVVDLPGVGRSTAGAILALSSGQRLPILDGNVKRVLARVHAVSGWPGQAAIERELWRLADDHTPESRVADYTQAIMDLGATLCLPRNPQCPACPVKNHCRAAEQNAVDQFPGRRPLRSLPSQRCRVLVLVNQQQEVLLERRPPTGIWGGLWSFPESPWESPWESWCEDKLQLSPDQGRSLDIVRHTFSHFHLEMHPVLARVKSSARSVMEPDRWVWYNTASSDRRGFPAPIMRLLEKLTPQIRDGA